MRSSRIIAGLLLASCLVSMPASAGGLLGGVLGGVTNVASQPAGGGLLGGAGGLLGGGSTGSSTTAPASQPSISVPGVASVSSDSNGGTHVNVGLLGGGGSTANVGLHNVIGGSSNLGVSLPNLGGLNGTVGGVVNTVNGVTGNGGTVDTVLGSTGLTGPNGGLGGLLGGSGGLFGTTDATGGGGVGPGGGNGGGINITGRGGAMYFANLVSGVPCASQDPRAIARLLQSRTYNRMTLNSWRRAANVHVVPIKLCPQVRASVRQQLAMTGAAATVQGLAAADPLVSASLGRTRYGAGNVLAVDQANGMLTVYVY